jgi:hypothetical protein
MTCPYLNSQWVTSAETARCRILHSFLALGEGALTPSRRAGHPAPARAGEGMGKKEGSRAHG